LDSIFCAYTIEKQIEDSTGDLNPHNLPLQTTQGLGDNYGKMHTSLGLWRMH